MFLYSNYSANEYGGKFIMEINEIFSDNMILQANKPVRIFGTGKGIVKFEISNRSSMMVSKSEHWLVEIESFDYGGPYTMTVTMDSHTKEFRNIYFGDVFLLSGQSNV